MVSRVIGTFIGAVLGVMFIGAVFVIASAAVAYLWNLVFSPQITLFQAVILMLLAWISFKPNK